MAQKVKCKSVKTDCEALAEQKKALDEFLKKNEPGNESSLLDKLGSK
jgi:hypothetical protein